MHEAQLNFDDLIRLFNPCMVPSLVQIFYSSLKGRQEAFSTIIATVLKVVVLVKNLFSYAVPALAIHFLC